MNILWTVNYNKRNFICSMCSLRFTSFFINHNFRIAVICCKNHCYIIFFTFFCNFTDAFINNFAGFFSCF